MHKITVIGKPGCSKCSKMETILGHKGWETELIYIETPGEQSIKNISFTINDQTHFPLFIFDGSLYKSYKDLNKELTMYTGNEY